MSNMLGGGLHKQEAKLAQIESMKIIANYAPNIDLVYERVFYKNFSIKNPSSNKLLFSRNFSLFYKQLEEIKNNYSNIVLYGYGTLGKNIEEILKDKINYITDKNENISKETKKFTKIETLKNIDFDIVLISVLGREIDIIKMIDNEFYALLDYEIKINKRRYTAKLTKEVETKVLNNIEAWLSEERLILTPDLLISYRDSLLYFKSITSIIPS